MESANFHDWFCKLLFPAVEEMLRTGPVVLFLDGHQSHSSLPLVEEACAKGIILFVYPPHTMHLLQPLDVGVFGPLKQVWSEVLKAFKLESKGAKVDKAAFPSLVSRMWDHVLQPHHLIGGFRATGVHPLSREAIPPGKLKTSMPFQSEAAACSPPVTQCQSVPHTDSSATPVSTHIAQLFGNLFTSDVTKCNGRKGRVCPTHYGEALMEDKILERIREQEEKKKEQATKRGKPQTR